MRKKRILLVEDEVDLAAFIRIQAQILGYRLDVESDGLAGYRAIKEHPPDLVLLDVMLPQLNGLDICRKMKQHAVLKQVPVLFLSAKNEELDVVLGLELGADDYVSKPFSPKVLFSRIRSLFSRESEVRKSPKRINFGEFVVYTDRHLIKKGETNVSLTLSEIEILRRLVIHRGKVLTRSQLIQEIRNEEVIIVERNVDVHIASLRKKLGPNFSWVETVRGVGYRFVEKRGVV